ncbi:MAG: hypothetical protein GKR89_16370 [Candidatus Latescibacteria bacterium]|nr:hypothetical protein [Candidatus Latescibacterota bacterium]
MSTANPYTYIGPLAGRGAFYNRVSEIMRVTARITTDRPQSVSIVGGAKSGKTALLDYLNDATVRGEYLDDPQAYVFLRLDLGQAPPDSPETFFSQIAAAWTKAGEPAMEASGDGFSRAVKELMGQKRSLVLFCDDFGTVTQNSRFPLEFFSFMRSVANSSDVGYVMTSSSPLQELCHTQAIEDSPFFNIFTTVNLDPFKPDDARLLVGEAAERAGQPFGERVEWILALAGGSPYLLQLTAHCAFANPASDGDQLAECAYKEAEGYLSEIWKNQFSAAEREVLTAVHANKKIEPRLLYAAEDLEHQGYLRQGDKGLAFEFGLLQRFVAGQGGFWKRLFG